ncbi:hypothetical protein [Bacillus sp. LMB3902]|uniref:hypothetical protein n=1 Tax=Bacillus sp. LMB3902 TaxID=3139827 RepID=UPI003188B4C6
MKNIRKTVIFAAIILLVHTAVPAIPALAALPILPSTKLKQQKSLIAKAKRSKQPNN